MNSSHNSTSRLYKGHPPKRGKNLAQLGGFHLWLTAKHSWPWASLKLVAAPGIELPKANYRLGWSVTEQRLADGKDLKRLRADHPGISEMLYQVCSKLINPDSVPKPVNRSGVDAADLQALRVDLCNVIAKLDFIMQGGCNERG